LIRLASSPLKALLKKVRFNAKLWTSQLENAAKTGQTNGLSPLKDRHSFLGCRVMTVISGAQLMRIQTMFVPKPQLVY
jgi:hypothetical protein